MNAVTNLDDYRARKAMRRRDSEGWRQQEAARLQREAADLLAKLSAAGMS